MSSRSVEIRSNDDRSVADVDPANQALVTTDAIHRNIHRGVMFHVDKSEEGIADDGSVEILIQVGSTHNVHLSITVAAGGDHKYELYEDTTFSGAGTALTPTNRDRRSSTTSASTFTHTPSISADGTLLTNGLRPGGHGGNSVGGSGTGFAEWILATDTVYLVRLTNLAGTAKLLSLSLDFYEHAEA